MFLAVYCIFDDRIELRYIPRVAPDEAKCFLKIMGMWLVEVDGL